MKILRTGGLLCLVALSSFLHAQEAAPAPAAADAAQTPAPVMSAALRQLVLVDSLQAAPALPTTTAASTEFVVLAPGLPRFNLAELTPRLSAGNGLPITEQLLAAVAQVVENFVRQNDYPAVQVVIPPQDISNGVVRVAVLLGKVRKIEVTGNHWFSESLLRRKLSIERGETLRYSELDRAISWTNDSSPFRRVRVDVQPVGQTGEVDIKVAVQERLPLRFQASYDNSGPSIVGRHRFIGALTYANLWGQDHQVTYQYLTSDQYDIFQGHALDYRAPLPWRHVLQFSASYSQATPTLFDGFITQRGESVAADLRYAAPFTFRQRWRAELTATLGFKQTNNNLFFLDEPVPFETTDSFTLNLGASAGRDDKRGRWIFSANLIGSPGDVNSRNTATAFADSRFGGKPRFVYGQVAAQRLTQLTPKIVATSRAIAQLSSANLLGSEQFSVGGFNTVRGYSDRGLSGDSGYTFSQEFQHQGPTLTLHKRLPQLATAGVVFADYGRVVVKHPFGNQLKSADIGSVGVGLRFSAASNFSAGLDYGWALVDMVGEKSQLHAKVSLAF